MAALSAFGGLLTIMKALVGILPTDQLGVMVAQLGLMKSRHRMLDLAMSSLFSITTANTVSMATSIVLTERSLSGFSEKMEKPLRFLKVLGWGSWEIHIKLSSPKADTTHGDIVIPTDFLQAITVIQLGQLVSVRGAIVMIVMDSGPIYTWR